MMHEMWYWNGMGFGLVFWLVLFGLIIWGVKTLARASCSQKENRTQESAIDVLKRRYARGEIDDEEFEEKRRRLTE